MADLAVAGQGDAGINRLTLVLLAGVLSAGGMIAADLEGRAGVPVSRLADKPLEEKRGAFDPEPEASDQLYASPQEVISPTQAPSDTDLALLDMSPELKAAFDTVLRGKTLLEGGRPDDILPEDIREKASVRIGYALQATPGDGAADRDGSLTEDAGAPWVITGKPLVLSGDSFKINDVPIRLHGIRAPSQEDLCRNAGGSPYDCAAWSREALSLAIGSRNVSCDIVGTPDLANSQEGWCHLHMPGRPAIDLSGWMVSAGAALVAEQGEEGYQDLQEKAKAERVGLWFGSLGLPEPSPDGTPR